MTTLAGLLRRTWFYVSLYWCRHGREGQRDLRRDSVKFTRHASLETSDLENNKNEYDKNNGKIFSVSYVITEKGKTKTVQRSMSCALMKEKFVFCSLIHEPPSLLIFKESEVSSSRKLRALEKKLRF